MGRWPGGQDIPPRAGGDRTGPGVPSSLALDRLLPGDFDKSGWLWVANVIWGRAGGNPPSIKKKNRFRMDNRVTQSEQEEGRAPPRPRPFPALRARGRGKDRSRVTGTRCRRVAWARGARARCPVVRA